MTLLPLDRSTSKGSVNTSVNTLVRSRDRVRDLAEVYTGPAEVAAMLDLVADTFEDRSSTYLEPACGDGNFAEAILTRLLDRLDDTDCGHGDGVLAAVRRVVCVDIDTENVDRTRARLHRLVVNHLTNRLPRPGIGLACSIPFRRDLDEILATNIICGDFLAASTRALLPYESFSVVVGNPPYQFSYVDTSDRVIYSEFVLAAIGLSTRNVVMVTPSRWFAGGKGVHLLRPVLLGLEGRASRLTHLVHHPDSATVFPGVEIKGGVSWFRWDASHDGPCEFTEVRTAKDGTVTSSTTVRDLAEYDVFIRVNEASTILDKIKAVEDVTFTDIAWDGAQWRCTDDVVERHVSPQIPFGLRSNFADHHAEPAPGDLRLLTKKAAPGTAFVDPAVVTRNHHWVAKWKVLISKSYNGGESLPHQVTGRPFVVEPSTVCTQTWLVAGAFDTQAEAEAYSAYLSTRFVRFLVHLRKPTQDAKPSVFRFVPSLPMDRTWTDADLYARYGLSDEEISVIEAHVRAL
jgi:hypothetical protein